MGELTTQPLNPSRPLWQFHLFEDFETGRSALVARIHHCIADGIALISVMLSITDGGKSPPARKKRDAEEDGEHDWISDYLLKPAADLAVKAIGVYGAGLGKGVEMMADPAAPLAGSLEMARIGAQVVSDVAAMALMPDDSPTSLKGKATPGKRVAWGEPLPLAEVKAVGQALGGSINDVLLASVAGAIGSYLRDKGEDPTGKEIRAMVPVNLRPLDKAWQLGNRFGLVPLVLPIGIANPIDRLAAVRARMNELKGGYQPLLAFALLAVAGVLIKPVQHALLNLFAKKATAVMTNVPGPATPLKICGRTLEAGDVLGAGIGRHRHGRQHPQLRRRRAVRPDHRCADVPGPGRDRRPFPAGVRQAAVAGDDAAVGALRRRVRSLVLELRLRHLHVQPLHRVQRLALARRRRRAARPPSCACRPRASRGRWRIPRGRSRSRGSARAPP